MLKHTVLMSLWVISFCHVDSYLSLSNGVIYLLSPLTSTVQQYLAMTYVASWHILNSSKRFVN